MEEKINFEEEAKTEKVDDGLQKLDVKDLSSGNWIKNPKVGEEIILDIVEAYKDTNVQGKTKDGTSFSSALSGVDFKYTLKLRDGAKYSPPSWEIWGKIKALMIQEGKTEIKVSVKHVHDGQLIRETPDRVAKLNDISVEEADKLIQGAKKAKIDKKLYDIKLI